MFFYRPLTVVALLALLSPAVAAPPAASLHPELWPSAVPTATDPATEAFVDQLLLHMSLEEKIGQMIQADIASIVPADLRTYKLGSILAGGNAAPGGNVRTTAQAWLDLTDEFYRAALAAPSQAHPAIPILFGIDAVHGHAKVIGATIYPHNIGLGAAHDPELIRRIGEATAQEIAATGIDWTFAPTVAVARDVRWGRSFESYSEAPQLVAAYAAAMVTGLQGARGTPQFMSPGHTLSSVKHFLGDGGVTGGRDQGDAILPEVQLRDIHGAGYTAAIKAGVLIVMASYNSWNGIKLHADHYLLTDILKGRLGFNGFVVGDWNAHEEIPGCTKYRCAAAILAGIDMLMAPDSWRELFKNTLAQARSGEIPQSRIDDAVRRILRVKTIAGMFKRPAPKQRSDAGDFTRLGSAAHRALAREAVRKSLVLLKNDHGILPLNPHSTILVAGEAADSIGRQTGGWTIDWQGDHNSNADFPGATSIFGGIQATLAAAGGSAVLSKDGQFARKPDVAVVVFGEKPYAEFEGDRENLEFSPNDKRDLDLLRRLHAAGVPTVSIFLSGRPMWVNPEINASDAFVAAWLPGSEGEGVADVLFRGPEHYDFTGRLAFSWPATAMPVRFDAAGKVSGALFARGWGLDYETAGVSSRLPENARIPPYWDAPAGSLYHAHHVTAPWSIFVADGGAEVHLTTRRQASPGGAVTAASQSEGTAVQWSGTGSGLFTISGRPGDMRPQAAHGVALRVRYRVDRMPESRVNLGLRCAEPDCGTREGAMRDVTKIFKLARPRSWQTLSIPLSCFAAGGADLAEVAQPFAVETSGRFALTISEVSLMQPSPGDAHRCPGTM
ncbi:MAG TPA: glycoside hydrolase family 3 N-terminal domain-containing protein [Steroidobacteraceae bacterium]|jgi:beta-glucosidase|nr:glycoside hydrolase family 3 N-terminal domain-containing protein [Steroidobacteraceae bacterium]